MTTFDRVQMVIGDILGCEEDDIQPGTTLENDLGADDIDLIELQMDLEEEFSLEITECDWEKLLKGTVADIVRYVDEWRSQS